MSWTTLLTNVYGFRWRVEYGKLQSRFFVELRNNLPFARLANMITVLDCTFSFCANFPCRLTVSERKFDLPSDELLFSSAHPFSEPRFIPSRLFTAFEAFQSLFDPPTHLPNQRNIAFRPNAMDMFILIHRKCECLMAYCIIAPANIDSSLCPCL
jgi:hypothetical protein